MVKQVKKYIPVLLLSGLFLASTIMFCLQSIRWDGRYISDLSTHIAMSKNPNEENYSIFILLIQLFLKIGQDSTILIGVFLGLVTASTVVVVKELVSDIFDFDEQLNWFIAFVSIFVMPIYIPEVNHWYLGLWVGNVWHNPTYLCMRLFAICTLIILARVFLKKSGNITVKEAIGLSVLLLLEAAFKPNFILILVPALGIYFLISLIKEKGKNFKQLFYVACTFIPSGLVLLTQYFLMFGEGKEGGLGIDFAYFLKISSIHPLIGIVQSMLFMVLVLVYNFKRIKEKGYGFVWLLWGIGLIQYLFLIETGPRTGDGNWTWGFYFCNFILFIYSMGLFLENIKRFVLNKEKNMFYRIYIIGTTGVFGLQFVSGIIYFIRLLGGEYYF